jgi:hypothetical protein
MNEHDLAVVTILALTDAIWLPNRRWDAPRPANTYFARLRYDPHGVRWVVGGDEARRKAGQRLLEDLAQQKLVKVSRPKHSREQFAKLTPQAEAAARRIVGLPGWSSGWATLEKLGSLTRPPAQRSPRGHGWVRELVLAGWENYDQTEALKVELVAVSEMALTALNRGLIEASSDPCGRVSYQVTDSGWDALARGEAPPDEDDDADAFDTEAAEAYSDALFAMKARLDTMKPERTNEIGGIPLCGSLGPPEPPVAEKEPANT